MKFYESGNSSDEITPEALRDVSPAPLFELFSLNYLVLLPDLLFAFVGQTSLKWSHCIRVE
ncbi:hypothetical protein BpHYR1_005663 [Brachionus plicatilis]|uniref:Uncharacterized protein n=1 Tax=Brachionus plicatilis TaxID=10195 RepID=A0A3M7Q0G0_BRAPC|nr:hypothetical protein BpHYR1_005663 [Brachionus plicatilis]